MTLPPKVGDIIHIFPSLQEGFEPDPHDTDKFTQPRAAIVTHVLPDARYVTALVLEYSGKVRPLHGIPHRSLFPGFPHHSEWQGAYPPSTHWEVKE